LKIGWVPDAPSKLKPERVVPDEVNTVPGNDVESGAVKYTVVPKLRSAEKAFALSKTNTSHLVREKNLVVN
jgi:hypothetical protein